MKIKKEKNIPYMRAHMNNRKKEQEKKRKNIVKIFKEKNKIYIYLHQNEKN